MLQMTKNSLRLFFRNIALVLAFGAVLAAPHLLMLPRMDSLVSLGADQITSYRFASLLLQQASLFFLLFAFIGYEFFSRSKRAFLLETVKTCPKGHLRLLGAQFLAMELLLLAAVVNVSLYFVFGVAFTGNTQGSVVANLLLSLVLYFLLSGTVALLLGCVLALCAGRMAAYGVIVLWSYLASDLPYMVLTSLQEKIGPAAYWLRDLLGVCFAGEGFVDPAYGLPVEWYRFALALFWVLALGAVALLSTRPSPPKNRRWVAGGMVALSLFCLTAYLCKQGYRPMDSRIDGGMVDSYYLHTSVQPREEPAGFAVSACEMDLRVGDGLKARVVLDLEQTEGLAGLKFTLYHGYRLQAVTDGAGNRLPFEREGDYLYIPQDAGTPLSQLTFSYGGMSGEFYSNTQGIHLPGYFPYFPMEGYHRLDGGQPGEFAPGAREPHLTESRPITLRLQTRLPVFVSLPQQPDGSYAGLSTGATIFGGQYVRGPLGSYDAVMPQMPDYPLYVDGFEEALEHLGGQLGVDLSQKFRDKPLFVSPQSFTSDGKSCYIEMEDCYVILGMLAPRPITNVIKMLAGSNLEKQHVAYLTHLYLDVGMRDDFIAYFTGKWDGSIPNEFAGDLGPAGYKEMYQTFMDAIEKNGEDAVLKQVGAYLTDDGDTRDRYTFVNSLME